jgi:hypothetical protein
VAAQNAWTVWTTFCQSINVDPGLGGITDPLPILLIFARRYRNGRLAPAEHPVRARTAEDAIRQVGQAFTTLGLRDPRLNELGWLDFCLVRIVNGWKRQDTPTKRKKPVPKQVLVEAYRMATVSTRAHHLAMADLLWLGFYFLLRPGEYLHTTKGRYPFRLQDVEFYVAGCTHLATTIPLEDLSHATSAGLTFTMQKNGIPGEVINLSCFDDPHYCPFQALVRCFVGFYGLRCYDFWVKS